MLAMRLRGVADDHRRPDCPSLTAKLKARGLRQVQGKWVPADSGEPAPPKGGGQPTEEEQGEKA